MKVAALDLGSNTFLCLIAEVHAGRIEKVIADEVEIVRLGQGLCQGARAFHPEALLRAKACLEKFSVSIQRHHPEQVLAMATAAARDVENAQQLIEIGHAYGIPIEIIPGSKEAEITYQGAISGEKASVMKLGVLDIGGGSTELIVGQNGSILDAHSFPFGCVKLTERFFQQQPPRPSEIQNLQAFIATELQKKLTTWSQENWPQRILAVAGTPTELARVHRGGGEFNSAKIDGTKISGADLEMWLSRLSPLTPSEIHQQWKIQPGRADVILSGIIVLQEVLKALQLSEFVVSTRGVRYGVALEMDRRKGKKS